MIVRMENHKAALKSHPLWMRWVQLKRRNLLCENWRVFGAFVEAVSPQPANSKKMRRLDDDQPYGPGNWEWTKTPTREESLAYFRAWNKANPDDRRAKRFLAEYGITISEYDALHAAQEGKCAICASEELTQHRLRNGEVRTRMLAVDHNHNTGAVRGLLCGACNRGLGSFYDDPNRLSKAIEYLHQHDRRRLRAVE